MAAWQIMFGTTKIIDSSEGTLNDFQRGLFERKQETKKPPVGDYAYHFEYGKGTAKHVLKVSFFVETANIDTIRTRLDSLNTGATATLTMPTGYGTFNNCVLGTPQIEDETFGEFSTSTGTMGSGLLLDVTIDVEQLRP